MTELTGASHMTPCNKIKMGAVGVLVPGHQCKIISTDGKNTELGTGQEGEILIKGAMVMKG